MRGLLTTLLAGLPGLALAGALAVVGGAACDDFRPTARVAFAVIPPPPPTYLRYRVHSTHGDFTREFVVGPDRFVELRESGPGAGSAGALPAAGGRRYALGLFDAGRRAWMQVGDRPPVEIDGPLAADERTDAAWLGMHLGDPASGVEPELEACRAGQRGRDVCTFVYTPTDGHALWVDEDRATGRPVAFARVGQHDAIETCDAIAWSDAGGSPVVASATCTAIVDRVGRDAATWTLEERRAESEPPEESEPWARVAPEDIVPLEPLREPLVVPVADPSSRVYVTVHAGGSTPLRLVLDTGSPYTVLTRRAMEALGVVPSPEPPLHVMPPFLAPDSYDAAIVDRFVVGDDGAGDAPAGRALDLRGLRVLIPRHDAPFAGDEAGLLGMDVLSRYVTDVDGPAATLRIWPRASFVPDPSSVALPFEGASHGDVVVAGAIDEVGPMPLILDTGAPINVVVGGPAMHAKHPHHAGDDAVAREDGDGSDYASEVRGLWLGPFALPRMPATGHDRRPDLPFLDDDGALVGLGVLRHFRVAIDTEQELVHVTPGPSFVVLASLGVEIDTRDGAPTVTRVVEGEQRWQKPLRVGNVVVAVDGRPVGTRDEALGAIAGAAAARDFVRVTVERRGNRVTHRIRFH